MDDVHCWEWFGSEPVIGWVGVEVVDEVVGGEIVGDEVVGGSAWVMNLSRSCLLTEVLVVAELMSLVTALGGVEVSISVVLYKEPGPSL